MSTKFHTIGHPRNGKSSRYRLWIAFRQGFKHPNERPVYFSVDWKDSRKKPSDAQLGLFRLKKMFTNKMNRVKLAFIYDNMMKDDANPIEAYTPIDGWFDFSSYELKYKNGDTNLISKSKFKFWVQMKEEVQFRREKTGKSRCPTVLSVDVDPVTGELSDIYGIVDFRDRVLGRIYKNQFQEARIYKNDGLQGHSPIGKFTEGGELIINDNQIRQKLITAQFFIS